MSPYILFSIDNVEEPHSLYKFLKLSDNLRSVSKLEAPVRMCIGCYRGEKELSFLATENDFNNYYKPFCVGQESVLHIPPSVKQPCILQYTDGRVSKVLGRMRMDGEEPEGDYTYLLDNKTYWSCNT